MNPSELAMYSRIDDILRQRIAMGGCDGGEYDDYDMFGDGIIVGGGRYGGAGTRAGGKKAARSSPWVAFLKKEAKRRGISFGEAMGSAAVKAAYKKSGSKTAKKKAPAKRKTTKRKAPVRRRKNNPYGHPRKTPTATQLKNLGVDRKTWNLMKKIYEDGGEPLTERQLQRIGYLYDKRTKKGFCVKPNRSGRYILDQNYACEPYKKKKIF